MGRAVLRIVQALASFPFSCFKLGRAKAALGVHVAQKSPRMKIKINKL